MVSASTSAFEVSAFHTEPVKMNLIVLKIKRIVIKFGYSALEP